METPYPTPRDAAALLAHDLLALYALPNDIGRLEELDAVLERAGIEDAQLRDKVLAQCDKIALQCQAGEKVLARLLLRSGVQDLEGAAKQLKMKFGE
jgi:hypothetical protein